MHINDDDSHVDQSCQAKAMKCNCDIEIIEFIIESFFCMFPVDDCYCPCHQVGDDDSCVSCTCSTPSCSCIPCDDNSDCQAGCKSFNAELPKRVSFHPTNDEYKNEEDEDDGVLDYGLRSMNFVCFQQRAQ
eukprot:Sro302_g112130.2  (131) ;mRNA; r:5555-5947